VDDMMSFISSEFRDSYEFYDLSFQKLCLLLTKLVLYDHEFRKMIGESCEKRMGATSSNPDSSSSQLLEDISRNKMIHFILIYGTNHPQLTNSDSTPDKQESSLALDPSKALLLRQKLCFLQMICLLSVKYYKEPKLKPVLLSLLMISSMENELNSQIIHYYKKDKLIQKYLAHYLKEKELSSETGNADKDNQPTILKRKEKLKTFHDLVPENLIETLKIIWLK
jgi:hypothetical protein